MTNIVALYVSKNFCKWKKQTIEGKFKILSPEKECSVRVLGAGSPGVMKAWYKILLSESFFPYGGAKKQCNSRSLLQKITNWKKHVEHHNSDQVDFLGK